MSKQRADIEIFSVHVDGIVYSEHPYYTHAIKAAMSVAGIFPEADIEVVADNPQAKQAAA